MITPDFELKLSGFGLTTANILYRLPDHPGLVQEFIWQHADIAPKFPRLMSFLEFWEREIDGPMKKVTIAHHKLITPQEWRSLSGEYQVH